MQHQQHQPQQQQIDKKERRMFTFSDDSEMMKQIVATHSLDGRDMDLEPILHITEKTPRHAFSASIEIVIDETRNGHIIRLTGEEKAVLAKEKKHDEYFLMLERIFDATHLDNLKIIKALFYPDISHEEVLVLTRIYKESRRVQPDLHYEVVWEPVVDNLMTWNDSHQHKLEQLQLMMTWHMLQHPTLLIPAVIKYIKQVWNFEKKPILVVLDPQGRVTSPNALHMVWIWGNIAYPFTSIKEDSLWKEQSLTLELLVDSIDRNRLDWIVEEKCICLYGGDDLNWIRSFTKLAADIAHHAGIQLEMVYVGKSGTIERIRKISATISEEKLSHTWPDPTSVCFDGSDQGWALICKGSSGMARAKADLAPMSLTEYGN
ncbi:sieve element occlusion B-like protein [Tanacetum coccineum]